MVKLSPKPVLELTGPNGNVQAVVETDARSLHFYLFFPDAPDPEAKVKNCWVRNLQPAPKGHQVAPMKKGQAPMLPAAFCKHPDGAPLPNFMDVEVVWFEEGNGAALLEAGEPLAIIPPWSGIGGFHGYARDCTAENNLCWPMPTSDIMPDRIRAAQQYWSLWDDEDFWTKFRDSLTAPIGKALGGPETKYYAIDGGNWPPRALLLFDRGDHWLYITVGMSLRPQPNVEMAMDDPSIARRIELAAALDKTCPDDELLRFGGYLSAQSNYPWSFYQWFGEGHTVPCDATPPGLGGKTFPAALLTSKMPGIPPIKLPPFRGDPINILWVVPITNAERTLAMKTDSTTLMKKMKQANAGFVHCKRHSVA